MPPRVRGRGSTRARGGGRGGAAAGRSSESTGEGTAVATPPETAAAVATEAPALPVVPKQDDDDDAKPPTTAENTPAPDESQQSPSIDAASTTRPPVQRLGSLNPSRSASPAIRRGSSLRGKKGPVKPTFTGRRSKEERAALEKEALEREKARTKEQAAADAKKKKDEEWKKKRDAERASRGRGGYSGAMSGPFSLGSSRDDRKTNHRSASTFGSGSGSRATRIKNEQDGNGEGSSYRSSGGGGGGGGGGSSIKREDGGFVSSEDEEDAEFPRKDIDLIEISSDEGEAAPTSRPVRTALPVRIGRKEHQERTFGINTDASSETAAKILEQADATGKTPTAAVLAQSTSKGKGKAKEAGSTSTKKPFKGVWQDSDELTSPVKTEDNTEDENMVDAEQIGIIERPHQPAAIKEASPETDRTHKGRLRGVAEPVLQTDEDRAEWARFQSNLSHIRAELGPEEIPITDGSGDVDMADANGTAKKATVRDNNVYLFQIPPLMPELQSTAIKKEPSDAPAPSLAPPAPTPAPAAQGKPDVKVKLEEGGFSDATKAHEAPRFASGCVGKVRVRQSGRTTLDWGGTSYELTPGNKASFLQEVVSIHVVPERERIVPEEAGEAVSFGRVKGKFVVTPDWSEMLG
ncbi:RNA polymerase III RPC4-domain-containing protein [Paraphoma chrysanthemicola]|nr:RNA polymerase III RPC4-domain-containing protein [Paraphoma chrysanthemicola]